MGHLLEAQICDVWGEPLAGATIYRTAEGGGLQVTDPLNDSRTARLTLSVYDKAAGKAKPLSRVLSVTYGPHLVFKGRILQVSTDYAAGTCDIYAHDPTIMLKNHYHRHGDRAVEAPGYSVDGRGMKILIESSLSPIAEDESGIPPNGILWGHNDTTPQDPKDEGGMWRRVENGANVWETVLNLSNVLPGPDFRFRPVDRDHVGVYPASIFQYGFMCELDTYDLMGSDKSDTIIFESGLGQDNAENVVHEPDGEVVRNHFTQVYPGGQRNRSDDDRVAVARANGSIHDYGLMEGYESGGQTKDTQQVLKEKAKAMVKVYARPPDYFQVVPRLSHPDVPKYPGQYKVGDVIRARARKGTRETDLVGRILSATLAAVDQAGNTRVTLECSPFFEDTIT